MHPWRLIISPPSNGFTNMAVDEAIFNAVSKGISPPTLRFYTWSPPAVSVGYFQDSLRELDVDACRKMGIDVVRRLTGGRAVLHDKELTYSVICPEDDPHFPGDILGTYKIISSCLVEGLTSVGIKASLTPLVRKKREVGPSACFSSPSHYEITVNGSKLVGSAQRRGEGVFLQHGSILTEFDREKLKAVLPQSGDLSNITSVTEHAGVTEADLISSLVKGFERTLDLSFTNGELTDKELFLSNRFKVERYSTGEWNFNRPSREA